MTSPAQPLAGRINTAVLVFLGSIVLAAGLITLLLWTPGKSTSTGPTPSLVVYCAAGIRLPVEAIAKEYEQAYGIPIQLNYGGSQTLLASLEVSGRGDLYLPADDGYVRLAREKHLAREAIPIATMNAVLCVKKGNPKNIKSLQDLLRSHATLAQANPDAAAIGKLTRKALQETGQWVAIEKQTKVFKGTVHEAANDVKLEAVDAAFVWDVVAAQYPELESVRLPELKPAVARIALTVLRSTTQPTAALRFARYLAARDKGLPVFQAGGYEVVEGDAWAEQPELHLFSGAMLRPAVEDTISEFERREGARITRVYNGCGILVAQMKAGERPDAYFSCEKSFMSQVENLFLESYDISMNQLVILTPKGNPRQLKTLQDLGQANLKIGLGHEKQSALGALTKEALVNSGAYDQVRRNVAVESPTGDFLVNQLRAGSLDATVVYFSNANASKDQLEIIPIETPDALAIQPVAVGRQSQHKQLASRLIEAVKSNHSKERFLSKGFRWKWNDPPNAYN